MAQPQTSLRQNLNEPEYEYGTGGLLGAFAPVRREIISPAQSLPTGYTSTRRGVGVASDKIPAQYGEVEVDPTYAPAYRGLKSALHAIYDFGQDPMGTIRGMVQSAPEVAGSIDQYMRDQYTAGALGGTAYNPETGQVTEFDPTVAMVGGAPAGVQAVRAATPGTVTLGSAGGKVARGTDGLSADRMQRAVDQGYSGPYYHATMDAGDIDEFKPKYQDNLTFVSPTPDFANSWIGKGGAKSRAYDEPNYSMMKADQKLAYDKYAGQYGDEIENWPQSAKDDYFAERAAISNQYNASGASVMPLMVRAENTFDPAAKTEILDELIRNQGYDPEGSNIITGMNNREAFATGNYILLENPEVVEFLKGKGFDSMLVGESNDRPTNLALFNTSGIRSEYAAFDPENIGSSQILASGSKRGTGVALGSALGDILPPLENAQKTQLGASTIPSYEKAGALLGGGRTLDFGAGRGQGASKIGADTFEPYPREGFNPTYTQSADIPDASYDNVTSLNVLNVMPRDVRDQTVSEIGRVLRPGGKAIVTTRGRDVMSAKGPEGPEPMSRITTSGTYQKGFTQPELREYTASVLGPDYTVDNLPEKIGQAGVMITKNPSATLRSGSKRGTGVALGSALTGSPDVRIIGGDIPEVTRDMGLLQRVGDAERVNRMNVDWEPAQFNEVPILNAQDLEGRGYASTMVDTTRSGLERVAAINGVEIPYGVQHGGAFFGFQPENMKRKAIFANTGAGDVSTIFNKARAGQMLGGISPNADRGTVFVPYGLTGLSPDFATMGLDLMVPYAQQVMSPASKKALDKRIRDGVKSKKGSEFQGVSDWPGIDSPNISKYLSGIGGKRKNIGKALDEFGFGEGEGLTLSEARAIITEPSMFRPRFGDLNAAYGMDLSMGVGINPDHPTYGSEFYGSPLGAFRVPANIFDMNPRFRDIRDQKWVMEEERKKGRVQPNPKAVAGGMFGVFDQPTLDYLIGINAINP